MVTTTALSVATRPKVRAFGGPNSYFLNGSLPRHDVPSCRSHWRMVFRDWVAEQFAQARKDGAPLFPQPGSSFAQLQDLMDTFVLNQEVSLSDSAIQAFWLEYLCEHPARVDWWRRFQKLNGPCEVL